MKIVPFERSFKTVRWNRNLDLQTLTDWPISVAAKSNEFPDKPVNSLVLARNNDRTSGSRVPKNTRTIRGKICKAKGRPLLLPAKQRDQESRGMGYNSSVRRCYRNINATRCSSTRNQLRCAKRALANPLGRPNIS